MFKVLAKVILPYNISNKKRDYLWEVIAVGSIPFLTVKDVEYRRLKISADV